MLGCRLWNYRFSSNSSKKDYFIEHSPMEPDKFILLGWFLVCWDLKSDSGFSGLTFLVRSSSGHRPPGSASWRGLSTSASSACLCTAHFGLIYWHAPRFSCTSASSLWLQSSLIQLLHADSVRKKKTGQFGTRLDRVRSQHQQQQRIRSARRLKQANISITETWQLEWINWFLHSPKNIDHQRSLVFISEYSVNVWPPYTCYKTWSPYFQKYYTKEKPKKSLEHTDVFKDIKCSCLGCCIQSEHRLSYRSILLL